MSKTLLLAAIIALGGVAPAVAAPSPPFQIAQDVSFNVQSAFDDFLADIKAIEETIQAGKGEAEVEKSVRWAEARYRQNLEQISQHPEYSAALSRFAPYWVRMVGYYGAEALQKAKDGYAYDAPGYFLGHSGIRYVLGFAQDILDAYESFKGPNDPDALKQRKILAGYQAQIKQIGNKFWERLAANTQTPPDAYSGGDKAQLKAAAAQAWKALYPKDQIVAVRFPMASWERKKRTDFNSATAVWQHYDTSYLQVRLVAKENAKFHRLYTVHLHRNNQTGKLTISPDKKEHESFPHRLLAKNFKP